MGFLALDRILGHGHAGNSRVSAVQVDYSYNDTLYPLLLIYPLWDPAHGR
jgi:hypothetical protein